jgi:outer membrane protein
MKMLLHPFNTMFHNFRKFVCMLSLCSWAVNAIPQPLLTPEDAVNLALKNSFGILVARNNADIARINNTLGAAGMTPNITANGSGGFSQSNVDLETSTQNKIQSSHGQTTSKSAGLALSWVLFDGGKMFITKSKLNELEALGEIRVKDTIQQTVYNVMAAYYNVVSQKQQLASINEAIMYNKEQVKILQTGFDAGLAAKSSLLQAKIDLNVYQENAINQQYAIQSAKRVLNQILVRNPDEPYDVVDSISTNYTPNRDELFGKLYSDNISIMAAQKQIDIARLALREFKATRLPRINFTAGYNLSMVDNTASNILYNHAYGPALGATVSIPIYQTGTIHRQVATAKLLLNSAGYNFESIKLRVSTQVHNALTQFENQRQLLNIEKENEALAKENIDIAIERLRLGQSTSLEVRQAQESYVNSHTRRINFEYNLKIAETRLKQLVAGL